MTSPYDALRADVAAAEQADQAKDATIAQLQAQHTVDQGQIAALQAQVAALEAQLNPTPPPPPPPSLVWGANIGTNQGQLAKVDAALGGIGAARFYLSAGKGIHFPTTAELGGDLGNRILILSAKLLPQDVTAGKYDQQITATAKAAPTDRPTLLCDWHEPENDNSFTPQQFRDAQAHFAQLVHAAGNPQVKVALILMGETWNGLNGRNWRDWYAGPQAADVFCTDEYAWGPNNPRDLSTLFAKGRAAADGEGKPFCVTETGADPATFGTGQALLDALTKIAQRAKAASSGPVAMYFGPMPGDRWDISSDPKRLAAWKAGQQ